MFNLRGFCEQDLFDGMRFSDKVSGVLLFSNIFPNAHTYTANKPRPISTVAATSTSKDDLAFLRSTVG